MKRRHISEREADVAMFVLLILACVGIFTVTKWAVAFWVSLISSVMLG